MRNDELLDLLLADGDLVVNRFDRWATERSGKTFFHYGEDGRTFAYGEFGRLTDHIAGNLALHGIAKGDRVSVLTTNSLAASLMMFGIWKAGAIYCPVNFAFTGRLLAYQLNDTSPKLLVTDSHLLPALNGVAEELEAPPIVSVYPAPGGPDGQPLETGKAHSAFTTLDWDALTAQAHRPEVEIRFEDPANIVYTSGTTGPSKGVVQPHRWMAQYTFGLRVTLDSDDVIYNDLPVYHVGGAIANIVRAAWVGCEVAVWDRFSPNEFWHRIASRGATVAILLDVMIPWLMQKEPSGDDRANTLNKVYMQPLPLHHAEVARRFGFDFVAVGFGQTEAGAPVGALVEEMPEGEGTPPELYRGFSHAAVKEAALRKGLPVLEPAQVTRKGLMGLALPFCEVAVLDESDLECPPETAGQLAIRPRLPGLIMAQYLGKPEATVSAWRNLWLHTGDVAVRGADGLLYFLDRMGDRIRVHGENLSSFQVEDLINQLPAVQFCAVFAIRSSQGAEDDVVAYVVPAPGEHLNEEDVHEHARTVMPKYMRPRIVRIVDDLPRTATNKVQKYVLRAQILEELGGRQQ